MWWGDVVVDVSLSSWLSYISRSDHDMNVVLVRRIECASNYPISIAD